MTVNMCYSRPANRCPFLGRKLQNRLWKCMRVSALPCLAQVLWAPTASPSLTSSLAPLPLSCLFLVLGTISRIWLYQSGITCISCPAWGVHGHCRHRDRSVETFGVKEFLQGPPWCKTGTVRAPRSVLWFPGTSPWSFVVSLHIS